LGKSKALGKKENKRKSARGRGGRDGKIKKGGEGARQLQLIQRDKEIQKKTRSQRVTSSLKGGRVIKKGERKESGKWGRSPPGSENGGKINRNNLQDLLKGGVFGTGKKAEFIVRNMERRSQKNILRLAGIRGKGRSSSEEGRSQNTALFIHAESKALNRGNRRKIPL